jgi:membrane-associated HD superfamily phosphohydrolase
MYDFLLKFHNLNRWLICIALVYILVKLITGAKDQGLKRVGLVLLISSHIQLLIGIYQYVVGNWGIKQLDNYSGGMKEVMKNAVSRFWLIEHFTTMLIAIVFITLAYSNIKKHVMANTKPKKALWFLLIAIVLILAGMPWPMRTEGIARSLMPISA